jgi:hypothetical protein
VFIRDSGVVCTVGKVSLRCDGKNWWRKVWKMVLEMRGYQRKETLFEECDFCLFLLR